MRLITYSALLGAVSSVRAFTYNTRFENVTWDDDNWRLTTTNLDQGHYKSRMSLANGYLGINLAAVGPFFEVDTPVNGDQINGWPLFDRRQTFATIAGFYDSQPTLNGTNSEWLNQHGWESAISGVPHWSSIAVISPGGQVLNASVPALQISSFISTLDIGAGSMRWSYTWTPQGEPAIDVEYSMFVNKLYVNRAAVQLKLTPSRDMNVTVVDILDGDCAQRTGFVNKSYQANSSTIWTAVRPNGIANVTAYVYSTMAGDFDSSTRANVLDPSVIGTNSSSIAQSFNASLTAGQTATIEKFIGGASTDAFMDPQLTAEVASLAGVIIGFAGGLHEHIMEWESIMTKDSIDSYAFPENGTLPNDPNIVELQITSVTNPYHLLQNTVGVNAIAVANNNTKLDVNSISVCGLGSECYAGLIFWDAEVWMAPGLVVAFPQAAKQIANYRVEKFPQAQANVETAYTSSQNQTNKFSPGGAVYSWTSGRFGNCTGTGPCFDYEYHINGDVGLELFNYYAVTGDNNFFRTQLFPIYDAVAYFYGELLTLNGTTGEYILTNATDPDEYANHIDNPGYTMALIQTHLATANVFRSRFNMTINETWAGIVPNITIPVDAAANIILEYGTMSGSISVKQADVVLVDDFLDFPNPYTLSDLDYYAGRQSLSGPGMTYGVFSVVANEVSPSGCASYTYDLYGSQPYTRAPWFQYSEQLTDDYVANGGTHPAYPFLTGMGGANRVAVFGFLGLRLMLDSLNIDPALPPQIQHLDYRTIYWQGWAVNATSNATHTTLRRLPTSLANANSTFATAAIPVTIAHSNTSYNLLPNGTLTVPNRMAGYTNTVSGNIAQCQPVSSPETYEAGQFPLSAVDGSISTKWQPTQSNISSSLTVALNNSRGFQPITGFAFDWAQSPPDSYLVTFSNSSSPGSSAASAVNVVSANVSISAPFQAAEFFEILPYVSNTTNATLAAPVWSGEFATLTIKGNQGTKGTINALNGTGATVAEWAIIAQGGQAVQVRYKPRRNAV
ncbi:hypothetical protein B0A49_03140 [Cryomyces minteri]|uniref:alpha,alpha-trehalase n=1 Tax=Cryomyces minteri TaxID=331657 RepID=A0A4U0XSM7_9PEZI|nr:hypothetical protein B0A49_03140 [Cryomyces minteri]